MEEKRSSQRIKVILPAYFLSADNNELSIATTVDISANGICLSCSENMPIGKEFKLQTILPAGDKISMGVKVIWAREMESETPRVKVYRVGLKIINSAKPDETKFVQFYSSQLPASFIHSRPQERIL